MTDIKFNLDSEAIRELIDIHIAKAISDALKGNEDKVIEKLVVGVLQAKKDSWSNKTLFQHKVEEMIRDVATKSLQEWIDSKREKIAQKVKERISLRDSDFVERISNALLVGFAENFSVSVRVQLPEYD